ncbi:phage holin family protein [Cellulosimicrobium cellulans]|uniref:phage holin family protein n=1 Tax=Cellulosimicrobium cellulans TaxID=1710 RepID=UPI0019627934|nr:phage holin family protein [Cellulosimicrobium cellulans]MBN0038840.1 phage holin family protein [Cellulosimicrobium cellulans]
MIRFLLSFAINVVLAAVGLLVASSLFDGVTVHASGFVLAVLIFAVAQAVLAPFVFNVARRYASAILGGIGLVSTFLALWVATLVGDGLEISGASTWIGVTVVVWLIGALGGWFLGWLVLTRWWDRRQEQKRIREATAGG